MLKKASEVEEIFKKIFATHPNLQGGQEISMRREIEGKSCWFRFDLHCTSISQVQRPLKSAAWNLSMLIETSKGSTTPFAKAQLTVSPDGVINMALGGYLPSLGRQVQAHRTLEVNVKDLQDGEEFLRLLSRHFAEGMTDLHAAYLRIIETLRDEAERRRLEMEEIREVFPSMFP